MPRSTFHYCPQCATPLQWLAAPEDGGPKSRLRCPACAWTHWDNPTPVLMAVIELADREGRVLLARNAGWERGTFGLVAGFMEAGETPRDGIRREVREETALQVESLELLGVYDFQPRNQVVIAYRAVARGEIVLSPELAEYRLVPPGRLQCWPPGIGQVFADWLQSKGLVPQWTDAPPDYASQEAFS